MKQKHYLASLTNWVGLAIAVAGLVLDVWGEGMSVEARGYITKGIAFAGGLIVILRNFRANLPTTSKSASAIQAAIDKTAKVALVLVVSIFVSGCATTWPSACEKQDTPAWAKGYFPDPDARIHSCKCKTLAFHVDSHPDGLESPAGLLRMECVDGDGNKSPLPVLIRAKSIPRAGGVPTSQAGPYGRYRRLGPADSGR